MKQEKLKNIAYSFGKLLGIVGLSFVIYKLLSDYTLTHLVEKFLSIWDILIPLIMINITSIVLGIFAWHLMLKSYATILASWLLSYYYFTKTDIAKYLPGNVFHFIGRQAIASKLHISQKQMMHISLFQTISLVIGTLIASTLFALFDTTLPHYLIFSMIGISLLSLVMSFFIFRIFSNQFKIYINIFLTVSIGLQGIMMAWIVMYQLDNFDIMLFYQIASMYILSWFIGFITPGASGGLGVREGAFITIVSFLHISIPEDIVVFSILLVRLINILTDIILYLSTFTIEYRVTQHSDKLKGKS